MKLLRGNLLVIGAGPHYQEVYHAILEQQQIAIILLVDLQDNQEEISLFFHNKKLKPNKMLFLPEEFRNTITPLDIHHHLSQATDLSLADSVILTTEPKARKAYALWAIEQGLPIFMDKPISAFSSISHMDKLEEDYAHILHAAEYAKVDVVISCERRAHPGYGWVKEYLKAFIQECKVPITSIDIHFAGGCWKLPSEYFVENHPFKYGYGVLLHSGYHYVDLLANLLSLNDQLMDNNGMTYSLKVMSSHPADQLNAVGEGSFSNLSSKIENDCSAEFLNRLEGFGETDVLIIGQLRQSNRVLVNFSLKLLGTSLSLRKTGMHSKKHVEGRTRQEHVIIHLGPLCSLNIVSNPLKKLKPSEHLHENFTITVMNSPLIPNRESVLFLNREEISQLFPHISPTTSLNKYARKWQLVEFLQGRDGHSSLKSHQKTINFLHRIYSEMKTQLIKP